MSSRKDSKNKKSELRTTAQLADLSYWGQIPFRRKDESSGVKLLSDFTFCCSRDSGKDFLPEGDAATRRGTTARISSKDAWEDGTYSEISGTLLDSLGKKKQRVAKLPEARIVACRCFGGKMVSVTVRHNCDSAQSEQAREFFAANTSNEDDRRRYTYADSFADAQKVFDASDYKPNEERSPARPVSIHDLVQVLRREVFYRGESTESAPERDRLHGAVLLFGRTKSAKSLVLRGLVHSLLSHRETFEFLVGLHDRRPHLVTCEDPVEKWFRPPVTDRSQSPGIDYTPRDRTKRDYDTLSGAFRNALRQTPSCFLVGEIREGAELRDTVDFAGTGHLVVATMHAGSLIDAFEKIIEATNAKSPAERGLLGQRILAVVHLEQIIARVRDQQCELIVPTLWRRTPNSTAALVAAGIGSLAPHNPRFDGRVTKTLRDCLGRQWFAKQLLEGRDADIGANAQQIKNALIKSASLLDLRGN